MTATPQPSPNPYVGPRAFHCGETLYGRDREVMKLLDLLIAERIVLLYSPSGAGKTSLMQAGLIPEVKKEDFQVLPVMRVSLEPSPGLKRPPTTNRYVLSLLLSLEEALPVEKQMSLGELASMKLADYLERREAGADASKPSVLIFDQFEEILTVDPTDRAAKEAFFSQVGMALRDRHRWALFAMREEFLAGLDPYLRPVPTRLSTTFRLELLEEDAARLAMQQPARQAGVEFTDAAARKLVNDLRRVRLQGPEGTTEELGLYVEPVHLQVVCHRLWERLPADDREIGEEDIEAIGDVDSALAGYYVERVAAIAGETGVSERAIREWFDRQLISAQGIRGQVLQDHERSQGLENSAIARLVDAHLVRAEQRRGATWLELAHDRLIEPVRQDNDVWYKANLSTLQRQADLWERQGRPGGLLLRDEALVEAEQWATAHQDELTDTERDFLTACREAQAIAKRERRNNRLIRGLAIVTTLIMLVALYFFRLARDEAQKAQDARIVSLAQALAAEAADKQDDQGALLALQAYHFVSKRGPVRMLSQVDDALRTVLSAPYFSHTLYGHKSSVRAVAFRPDGKVLASGSNDNTVWLWPLGDPSATPTVLPGHKKPVLSVAFSPDENGQTLAAGSEDGTVWLWKPGNPNATHTILRDHKEPASPEEPVLSVAFSPDGQTLAAGSKGGTVRLWELGNHGTAPAVLKGHKAQVLSVAFSPDGQTLASGSEDRTIILWEVATKERIEHPPLDHNGRVVSVAFSPDRKILASGSSDSRVRLWNLENLSAPPTVLPGGHKGSVRSVAFSRDGKMLASGSWDRTVRLWELGDPSAAPIVLRGSPSLVSSVAFSPDENGQTLASGSWDGTVRLWELGNSSTAPTILRDHTEAVREVAFSPDGKMLASGSRDRTVRLWDPGNPGPALAVLQERERKDRILAVAFSPDGQTLASGTSANYIQLWDLRSYNTVLTPNGWGTHAKGIISVAFKPEGQTLASGSWDGTVKLWDVRNLSAAPAVFSDQGHPGMVLAVAFNPDGQTLASGHDDTTVLRWDARNPSAPPAVFSGHHEAVRSVAFSPDGQTLASGSDDTTIRLWDARNPSAAPAVLRGHDGPVESVTFSRDGQTLASGSEDTTIRLWDLENPGAVRAVLRGHEDGVWSVAFSPDAKGEFLASGSADTNIRIWIARPERLAAMVCDKVRRNLTLEEWRQFVGENIPYERTCPDLPIHPSFIEAGRDLAKAGDVGGAVAVFRKARTLDSRLDLDPRAEAKKFAAEGRVEQERGLAR